MATTFEVVDFINGAKSFSVRVAFATSGGNIELHMDSLHGALVGTCAVRNTGGWQTWTTITCSIGGATGVRDLFFVYTGSSTGYLFNVNWWEFN